MIHQHQIFFLTGNRKKFEIATDEVGNPIKQDTKKGQLREVNSMISLLSKLITLS